MKAKNIYIKPDDPEQAAAYHAVYESVTERAARYEINDRVTQFPNIRGFGSHMVFCGNYSRSIPTAKQRYILGESAIYLDGLETFGTPAEVARDYIEYKFPDKLRAKRMQIRYWEAFHRSQPLLCKPGQYRGMAYVDLKAAYWSIIQVLGWDVEYFDSYFVPGKAVYDFPFSAHKVSRNTLVTVGLPTPTRAYQDGKIIELPSRKKTNMGLWCAVQDVLHSIAIDVIRNFSPVYINTDGYIVARNDAQHLIDLLHEWGLQGDVRNEGDAVIYGVGAYTIGRHKSKRYTRFNPPFLHINPVKADDIKAEFSRLSEWRPPRY